MAEFPDWLWGPPSLLFDAYCKFFPQGQSSQSIRLTTQPHLVPRISTVILLLHLYAFVGYIRTTITYLDTTLSSLVFTLLLQPYLN
jgi:hypothetical protein